MKKFLISILYVFVGFSAFGAGENIPTSKSFVDSAVAQKQDKIPANNGTEQILMNTGTDGSVGTKDIYDSTGEYGTQTKSLVTAEQFNTAVQNAIDSEFECVGWNPNDQNDCWFVKIRGATDKQSKNLFDRSTAIFGALRNDGTLRGGSTEIISEPIKVNAGQTYTLSGIANTPGGLYKTIHGYDANNNWVAMLGRRGATVGRYVLTVTIPSGIDYVRLSGFYNITNVDGSPDRDIQFERGTVATAYQPYGQNIYLPSGD